MALYVPRLRFSFKRQTCINQSFKRWGETPQRVRKDIPSLFLCGEGQENSADDTENAKEAFSSASRGHVASLPVSLLCSPPTSLRLKCSHTFLLCSRCRWGISMTTAVQVNCPVMLRELFDVLQKWEHLLCGLIVPPKRKKKESTRMYAQVCFTNYLFKLFKKHMSKHPYQYFWFNFSVSKLFIMNLSCKLTIQSVFYFSVRSVLPPYSLSRRLFSECSVKGKLIMTLHYFRITPFLLLWRSYHRVSFNQWNLTTLMFPCDLYVENKRKLKIVWIK